MSISISLENQEQAFIEACIAKERWAQKQLYEDNLQPADGRLPEVFEQP